MILFAYFNTTMHFATVLVLLHVGEAMARAIPKLPSALEETKFVVDDIPVTVHALHDDKLRPIMLSVPGNGGWNYMSTELIMNLTLLDTFRVVTYDMRGIPSGTKGPSTWDAHIEDAIQIAEALRRRYEQPVWVLGYSTGTYVVTQAATRAHGVFAAVIAMGLLPGDDEETRLALRKEMWDNMWVPSWYVDLLDWVGNDQLSFQLHMTNELYVNGMMLAVPQRLIGPVDDKRVQQRLMNSMKALGFPHVDLHEISIDCPLYVIQGVNDTMGLSSVTETQLGYADAPFKQLFWIQNAGHMAHLTQPKQVAAAFREIYRVQTERTP